MLLISFKKHGYLAYRTSGRYLAREEVLSVVTHGIIGCYGDVHGTDMESLCWRGETGVHASRHP